MKQREHSTQPSDWKHKYLDALDKAALRERQNQQISELLIKALLRISRVAEGVDAALDKQLAGLRVILRDGSPSTGDLTTVLSALDGQLKRIDSVKSERAKAVAAGFRCLLDTLQALKPERSAKQQLRQFGSQLKARSQNLTEYPGLVQECAELQSAVLTNRNIHRISKPFWHRWQDHEEHADAVLPDPSDDALSEHADKKPVTQETAAIEQGLEIGGFSIANPDRATEPPEVGNFPTENGQSWQDSDNRNTEADSKAQQVLAEEPPFSRLNAMVCSILKELLQQVEPPQQARDNYKLAWQQLERGLNWYELVPTLENISLVVVSAFDENQREFEGFLSALNARLLAANELVNSSQQADSATQQAGRLLNESVRTQVTAMQDTINSATELEQLKTQVSSRLDSILSAMDYHQASTQTEHSTLSQQLDALVEQVKSMEAASAKAEQRIEEQRQMALRDVLTQLPNRAAYQQRVEQEYQRWQRYGRALSVVVCDIDHFKRVNDNFGHQAGDKVLRVIAKTLAARLRKSDFVARYGGEEFVVLLPETTQSQAQRVMEGVREAIAACPFHFKEQPLEITMSFGITEYGSGDTAEIVFARADKALYRAKDQGRNCCVLAELTG